MCWPIPPTEKCDRFPDREMIATELNSRRRKSQPKNRPSRPNSRPKSRPINRPIKKRAENQTGKLVKRAVDFTDRCQNRFQHQTYYCVLPWSNHVLFLVCKSVLNSAGEIKSVFKSAGEIHSGFEIDFEIGRFTGQFCRIIGRIISRIIGRIIGRTNWPSYRPSYPPCHRAVCNSMS